MNTFNELKLDLALARALAEMNFVTPTPIQAKAIPPALLGRDIMGCAETGTGKTAAFAIPMIEFLLKDDKKNALILLPTRELAEQVSEVIQKLTKYVPHLRSALLIGGLSMFPQVKALQRRPRIIIATPGRLMDHVRRKNARLDFTGMLVLDEADRMLDMGFAPQLMEILRYLPRERRTMLFSATFPAEIIKLTQKYLNNPEKVTIGQTSKPAEKVKQSVLEVIAKDKNARLEDEIHSREGSVLVFARTQIRVDRVFKYLMTGGYSVARVHGGRTQAQRNTAIQGFKKGEFRVLVATDIAARGLDISHIAHVINYDLPMVPEDYIHRIGRTARAGRDGEAVSFVTPEDRGQWRMITKMLQKTGSEKGLLIGNGGNARH